MMDKHTKEKSQDAYRDAGVNIDLGNEFVDNIKENVSSTYRTGVMGNIGGFGGLFDLKATNYRDPILVSATDGVGTKLLIAQELDNHKSIGIDLVAMCVNDLIVQGAEPLFFLDYFATGKLELDVAQDVVAGIANGCKQAGCALVGGETAEMPGMYGNNHYDLAGFAIGAVEREKILPKNTIEEGDIIVGLKSNGIHSNGYSLWRKVIKESGLNFADSAPFDSRYSLGEISLMPTKIYVKVCLDFLKHDYVQAMAHITGGGITENLPRVLPDNLKAQIDLKSWNIPESFQWAQSVVSMSKGEMLKTFNCGIGMILIIKKDTIEPVRMIARQHGEDIIELGVVEKNNKDKAFVEYV